MADETVDLQVSVAATPEALFECFVAPARLVRWIGERAELDPRPGGIFRLDFGDGAIARGEFVELDRPRRVVFTWGWEDLYAPGPGQSTVEVTFEPDGPETIVRLRHAGLPAGEVASHAESWQLYLPDLAGAVAEV